MVKSLTVAICDFCGCTEKAKAFSGQYNMTEYTIPDNWIASAANDSVHFCPDCAEKLMKQRATSMDE